MSDWLVGEKEPERDTRWLDLAVFLGLVLGVALLSPGCKGCPPGPGPTPGPTVTPTASPTVNYHPELLLTTQGPRFVFADGHATFEFRKVIFCCKNTQGTGWPGLSESAVLHAYNQGRATMLHWRVGPFRTCNEPEWGRNGIGGAYVEVNGLADLTQFNQAYFDEIDARIAQAGDLGIVVEVSSLAADAWGLKARVWSSGGTACAHPWLPQGNIQRQDHLSSAWKGPMDSVHRAFTRKVAETVAKHGNVILEDGTEPDQIAGAKIVWSLEALSILRAVESENGYQHHLFGSNFKGGGDQVYPYLRVNTVEYLNAHDCQPTDSKTFWGSDPQRPYISDECNPTPPMKPEAQAAFWQYANTHGTYWTLWRHDQEDNAWNASLSLVAQGGRPGWEDGCPYDAAPVASISCKRHSNNLFDCTPKSSNGQPIRPEGDITRSLCERAALGMGPSDRIFYSLVNTSWSIGINPRPNVFQWVLTGTPGASGTLRCLAPLAPAPTVDLCRGPVVTVQ